MKTTIHRVARVWGPGILSVLGILIVGTTLFLGATWAQNAEAQDADPVVVQNADEAFATDVGLIADGTGFPVEDVERAIIFQQSFSEYAEELVRRFPDQISSIWTEPVPSTRGYVQFTGDVPAEADSAIESHGLDPDNIVLTGDGMITMADHARRARLAGEALVDLGFHNHITFFDRFENMIVIELKLPEGAPQPSKSNVVEAVQDRVSADSDLQDRAALVESQDIEAGIPRRRSLNLRRFSRELFTNLRMLRLAMTTSPVDR